LDWIEALAEAIAGGRPAAAVTVVAGPEALVGKHLVVGPEGALAGDLSDEAVVPVAMECLATGRVFQGIVGSMRVYVEPHLPPPALVVVGAGHVAQPLAHLGKLMGFAVTVIDDRPEYANAARFPDADQVLCGPFLECLRSLDLGPRHYVVLVTRGHQQDTECLRAVVERPVAYIGMIGSRNRVQTVFRLLESDHGIDPGRLAAVYAPIGLDIGAQSPAEIAVSVAAELLKVRRGGAGESLSRLGRARVHGGGRHG